MPDVARTDSQRSDASSTLRPRVSFNRDVHVKRIVPGKKSHNNRGYSGDGGSQQHQYHVPLVKKEKLSKTKQELAEEAALVLEQIDSVDCVSSKDGPPSHLRYKSHTLPRKYKFPSDVDVYETKRKYNDDEFDLSNDDHPPKKPPRTFAYRQTPEKTSLLNLFKKDNQDRPKKSNLKRSVSDATNLKSKSLAAKKQSLSDTDDEYYVYQCNRKQLSPIIENSPKEDYFENKENIIPVDNSNEAERKRKSPDNATRILRDYINELDRDFNHRKDEFNEPPVRKVDPAVDDDVNRSSKPEVIIIDVDKAKKISGKKRKLPKFKKIFGLKKTTPTQKTTKKPSKLRRSPASDNLSVQKPITREQNEDDNDDEVNLEDWIADLEHTSPKIKETIATLERQIHQNTEMIHSSQQPPEKLPLTRGLTVDTMVKRLSNDKYSPPPPKTNILITPTVTVQHNNNQPFSYIRGVSPDKNYTSHNNNGPQNNCSSPVIYAQVVCDKGLNSNGKQTIHTAYSNGKKHMPHSDSDEGLGCEENVFGGRKYEHTYNTRAYNESDKFEEEYPITPKFKKIEYNGFGNFEEFRKMDSSARGQADGMDSKRRESFREPDNLDFIKPNFNDLSTRRDLLESRINRRLHEKPYRTSPEHVLKPVAINSTFITEKTSKHYRHGSTSPVGFTEKYVTESRYDKDGQTLRNDYRIRENFGENSPDSAEYEKRYNKSCNYNNSFENEPTSFDSHISDYRSSPENSGRRFETSQTYKYLHSNKYASKGDGRLLRSREHFKSNPEITHRSYEGPFRDRYNESYHDSLRREKYENDRRSPTSKYHSERYLERNDSERKDKFGDSGIENDFKRDSAENFRTRTSPQREYDSEDEGFASSLLIASERQHTDDSFNTRKPKREYDSDRGLRESSSKGRECPVRPERRSNEREYKTKDIKHDYVPRERSIDDGSHYDPRIDKDLEMGGRSTLKKIDSKPPKPEKKSSFEKVKQLFVRDSKKKKEKNREMVPVENLRARYKEYSGSKENLEYRKEKRETNGHKSNHNNNYFSRRRLSTPSPSPTRETPRKIEPTHSSWFKSLDRLSRKKPKKEPKIENQTSTEDEYPTKPTPTKNLRFFGDTDIESNDSVRQKPSAKHRSTLSSSNNDRNRSQSSRELHNISEETRRSPNVYARKNSYKSMVDVSESDRDTRGSRLAIKPPMSPSHRTNNNNREMSKNREERNRRRRNEVSSVESSTEGDSSQQSQRSVVYLHAATVGDIPGPGYLRNGRRAASREELASNGSSQIVSQKKTLSRSFSVLAPWRPRHVRESYDIDYTQYPKATKNGKYEQKVTRNGTSRKESSSTLKKRANETKKSNQNNSTLSRRSRSKESLTQTLRRSNDDVSKGSSSTLYKKKERQPKENNHRYYRERDDRKMSQKSMSVESLGRRNNNKENGYHQDVSRSVSMPRDPEKTAGWFKIQKKKKSSSTQRL